MAGAFPKRLLLPPLLAALLACAACAALGTTNEVPVSVPATNVVSFPPLTTAWRLVWTRPIPLRPTNASPFVAAADSHGRLWLADQIRNTLCVYDRNGSGHERVPVTSRGIVTSISLDDNGGRVLAATQRGALRFPLGEYYLFSMNRSSGRDISRERNRTYPQYWDGRSVAEDLELARLRGEFTAVTTPAAITRWLVTMTPRGTVFMALPLLSIIERHSADGRTISDSFPENLRPWSPCWLIATMDNRLLVGDALQKRIILLDTTLRIRASWPCDTVDRVVPAPRPDAGWLLLDTAKRTLELAGRDGAPEGTWSLPPWRCIAALMTERKVLWLFNDLTWTWQAYDRRK